LAAFDVFFSTPKPVRLAVGDLQARSIRGQDLPNEVSKGIYMERILTLNPEIPARNVWELANSATPP
jgi:hypothetical protein